VFFIGFMLLLGVSFSTAINLKFISGYRQLGNVLSSLACLSSMFMSALGLMLINDGVMKSIIPVLSDWRILPVLTVEFTSFYFAKKNFEFNSNSITTIKCAMLSSIVIVPVLSMVLTPLMGFQSTLLVGYDSMLEFGVCMTVLMSFIGLYFFDKRSGTVNSWFYLVASPLSLSLSMFFSTKLMQTHGGFSVMLLVSTSNCVLFFLIAILSGELVKIKNTPPKVYAVVVGTGIALVPLNVYAATMIAVEFITLLKRLSQIVVGVVLDGIIHRRYTLSLKDTLLVISLFIMALIFYNIKQV